MQSCRVLTLVVGPSCSDHCTLKGLAIKLIIFVQAVVVSCFALFRRVRHVCLPFRLSVSPHRTTQLPLNEFS